ncbi:MAG: hypothetical protein EZS28_020520, partial [Streblomastix strix]
ERKVVIEKKEEKSPLKGKKDKQNKGKKSKVRKDDKEDKDDKGINQEENIYAIANVQHGIEKHDNDLAPWIKFMTNSWSELVLNSLITLEKILELLSDPYNPKQFKIQDNFQQNDKESKSQHSDSMSNTENKKKNEKIIDGHIYAEDESESDVIVSETILEPIVATVNTSRAFKIEGSLEVDQFVIELIDLSAEKIFAILQNHNSDTIAKIAAEIRRTYFQ